MKLAIHSLLAVLFVCLSANVHGQNKKVLEPIDVFNLEYVSNPQISPDGKKIIYIRNYFDVQNDKQYSNLWIINTDGSENRPLTTGNHNDFNPVWCRDQHTVFFQSNQDGSVQIYKMWLDRGQISKLSNTTTSQQGIYLSPDGNWIAFSMFVPEKKKAFAELPSKPAGAMWNDPPVYIDELVYRVDGGGYVNPGHQQIFLLSTSGGSALQLTSDPYDHGNNLSWSTDSKSIYFSGNLRDDADYQPVNSELYRIDISSQAILQLTDRVGPDQSPKVSPDGKTIAYLGFDDKYQGYQVTKLYTLDLNTKKTKLISDKFDRDIYDINWAADGKGIYFLYDDEGNTKTGLITLGGNVSTRATNIGGTDLGRPYNSGSYSISDNGIVAFTKSTPTEPATLAISTVKDGEKVLLNLNQDIFQFRELASAEELWYESSFDNQKIQGWVLKPPHFDPTKKYPLILEIHGGPFANYGNRFSIEMQLYAAAGYVVLYTNPRGSTSYGEVFGNLIHHDYPNHDYEDLMSGVDVLIKKGYIDENKLFVTGGSGGGVLTAWIVGHTDRFSAAVVAKPVINWYSHVLTADESYYFVNYWFPGKPWDNLENYMKRSPISYVGNVKTPTMIMTGEEDFRTPMSETEQYYKALKLQKVETAMVRVPGSSHDIGSRPSDLVAKVVYILKWFETHSN